MEETSRLLEACWPASLSYLTKLQANEKTVSNGRCLRLSFDCHGDMHTKDTDTQREGRERAAVYTHAATQIHTPQVWETCLMSLLNVTRDKERSLVSVWFRSPPKTSRMGSKSRACKGAAWWHLPSRQQCWRLHEHTDEWAFHAPPLPSSRFCRQKGQQRRAFPQEPFSSCFLLLPCLTSLRRAGSGPG